MNQDPGRLAQELVASSTDIPSLPDIYLRIRTILQDPASSHQDVADALGTDPGITARLLKMANSAFYGRPGSIDTIGRAVGLLGTQQVHDLVLATTLISAFQGYSTAPLDPRQFWYTSVLAGTGSKLLAEHCGILDCERLFVAGLLAQIGQLLIARDRPVEMTELLQTADDSGETIDALQQSRLGFDYADVSVELFTQWQLPEDLIAPIRWHTRLGDHADDGLEASILQIAIRCATQPTQGLDTVLSQIDDRAWTLTGLSLEELNRLFAEAVELTDGLAPILLDSAA
jgi:HD-like signal output (HDOD) protein